MILVATGLKREARILAGPSLRVIAGGGDRGRLEAELNRAAGEAAAIISMGLCGALAADLAPGDWVVATRIVSSTARAVDTDPAWATTLTAALSARSGPMLGSDVMLAEASAKQAALAATDAIAVDMESHIAGLVAARHGLPLAVARVVSDAANRGLPPAARAGMAADGGMNLGAVLASLAADPRQLPSLIRVGAEAETAFRALCRGRDLLGPGLGRLDFRQLPLDVA